MDGNAERVPVIFGGRLISCLYCSTFELRVNIFVCVCVSVSVCLCVFVFPANSKVPLSYLWRHVQHVFQPETSRASHS